METLESNRQLELHFPMMENEEYQKAQDQEIQLGIGCEKCRICFNAYFCALDDKTDVYVIWVFFFGHQGKNLLW